MDIYNNQEHDLMQFANKKLYEYVDKLTEQTGKTWQVVNDIYQTEGGGHSILSEKWIRVVIRTINEPIIQRRVMFARTGRWSRTQPDRDLTNNLTYDHTNKVWRKPKIIKNPIFGNNMRILE